MLKRRMIAAFAVAAALALTACGGNGTSGGEAPVAESVVSSEVAASESADTSAASTSESQSQATQADTYFANNELVTDTVKIVITDYKVIQPGEEGNEYGDAPVIAFWYDTTNLSSEATNATTAWMFAFKAIQDNDPNVVNTLDVAALPDQAFLKTQLQDIKEGGTVSNAVAYTLDDTTTPVKLVASDMLGITELGEQVFEIAE